LPRLGSRVRIPSPAPDFDYFPESYCAPRSGRRPPSGKLGDGDEAAHQIGLAARLRLGEDGIEMCPRRVRADAEGSGRGGKLLPPIEQQRQSCLGPCEPEEAPEILLLELGALGRIAHEQQHAAPRRL
jgi:hypothetical protein